MQRKNKRINNYKKSKEAYGADFGYIRPTTHKSAKDYNRKKIRLDLRKEYGTL